MVTTIRRVTTPAGDPAWLVNGYETVKRLLADPRLGRSHPEPQKAARYSDATIFGRATGSPETERELHLKTRAVLSRCFSVQRLASLTPLVQELVDRLVDAIACATPPVDLHEMVAVPLPALVICELLGVPYEDQQDFRRWSEDSADMRDEARSRAGLDHLREYMRALIERKRSEAAADVISDLLAAQHVAPEVFTDEHVISQATALLFAGHETTVASIDRGLVLLFTHPEQLAALLRDPDRLVPLAVEEILRYPNTARIASGDRVGGIARYANTDFELSGTRILAGDLVLLDANHANLESEIFPVPAQFDITREHNPHLTFGHGPHFCLGAPLVRIELIALFRTLFTRLPTLRLAIPAADLRPRRHLLTGGLMAIPATW